MGQKKLQVLLLKSLHNEAYEYSGSYDGKKVLTPYTSSVNLLLH